MPMPTIEHRGAEPDKPRVIRNAVEVVNLVTVVRQLSGLQLTGNHATYSRREPMKLIKQLLAVATIAFAATGAARRQRSAGRAGQAHQHRRHRHRQGRQGNPGRQPEARHGPGRSEDPAARRFPAHDRTGGRPLLAPRHPGAAKAAVATNSAPCWSSPTRARCRRSRTRPSNSSRCAPTRPTQEVEVRSQVNVTRGEPIQLNYRLAKAPARLEDLRHQRAGRVAGGNLQGHLRHRNQQVAASTA